jgi:hypothetical protein
VPFSFVGFIKTTSYFSLVSPNISRTSSHQQPLPRKGRLEFN